MTTVAAIAKEAFDSVSAEFTDGIIKACTLTRVTQGAYNPATGEYETTETTYTGRALFDTSTPIEDILQGYVAGPGELLVYLEGLSVVPEENDPIVIGGTDYTVKHVGDVVGAGTFFACTVIKS